METYTTTANDLYEAENYLGSLNCQIEAINFATAHMLGNQDDVGALTILNNSLAKIQSDLKSLELYFDKVQKDEI